MTQSAKGLFRATGKTPNPILVGLKGSDGVYVDAFAREENDFYPTPPEPTWALLDAERASLGRYPTLWEPACGDGAMARDLEAGGFDTICTDLIDRNCGADIVSFYDVKVPPSLAIVTNPPFNECNSGGWIRHALDVLCVEYMALLLPLNWIGAESRAALWQRHTPCRVYPMRWRIDFTGQGAPPMLNAWFVWDRLAESHSTEMRMLSKPNQPFHGGLNL